MASKYNSYATKLNGAFQKAATATREALEAYQNAEKNRNNIKYYGEIELQKAKDDLEKVRREAWPEFQRTRDQLTRDLQREFEADQSLNPDALDANAVTLLNSGLAEASDLEAMAARFSDNATMSRLIAGKAKELAASERDSAKAQRLRMISYNAENAGAGAVMKIWDGITSASRYYSGEIHSNMRPESVIKMNEHWNDANIQGALKDF